MKLVLMALAFCGVIYGGMEVIELSEAMLGAKDLSWIKMLNGALYIDQRFVYLPHGNSIFIQARTTPGKVEVLSTQRKDYKNYAIMSILPLKDKIYFTLLLGNGRIYLSGVEKGKTQVFNLVERHGFPGRILWFNKVVYVGGLYWTQYGKYLDKYDNNQSEGLTETNKRMFNHLFDSQKGFTLSGYDDELTLIDSVNTISRTGEDAKSFMLLHLPQPYDITETGEVFLIDNVQGYFVKHYNEQHDQINQFQIANDNYRKLPDKLTGESAKKLKSTQGNYSAVYALYEKGHYIVSAFYQAAAPPKLPEPPYYYDISTKEGQHILTGSLKYPLVGEDERENVFFYIAVEGGWFEDDRIFLVGMSVKDIIDGMASSEFIDGEVARFIKSRAQQND